MKICEETGLDTGAISGMGGWGSGKGDSGVRQVTGSLPSCCLFGSGSPHSGDEADKKNITGL